MTHEADGGASIPDPKKLQQVVASAHRNGVRVLISIGGWTGNDSDPAFELLSGSESSRSKFVANVAKAIKDNMLDGVDIDWEYPLPGSADRFTLLIRCLRSELDRDFGAGTKLISVAVASDDQGAWYTQGISPDIYPFVDWLNIMAYDGPAVPHANYEWSIASFNFWLNTKRLPRQKAVLGVPFYSRPREMPYKEIIAADPVNAQKDCVAGGCYNGIPTIRRKTQYIMKAGGAGIMYWELSQDARGRFSLIDAIYREVRTFEAHRIR
jgi:chitinase